MAHIVGISGAVAIAAILYIEADVSDLTLGYIGGLLALAGYYVFDLVAESGSSKT